MLLVLLGCESREILGVGHRELVRVLPREHTGRMTDRDDFMAWVKTALHQAEFALHNGDPAPRRALWSSQEPVSVFGALRNAHGQAEIDTLFAALGRTFSHCTSHTFEVKAYDVVGDMAYTAGLEHTSVSVDGKPGTYTLRVTQVYRREDGQWRVIHRHADLLTEPADSASRALERRDSRREH